MTQSSFTWGKAIRLKNDQVSGHVSKIDQVKMYVLKIDKCTRIAVYRFFNRSSLFDRFLKHVIILDRLLIGGIDLV